MKNTDEPVSKKDKLDAKRNKLDKLQAKINKKGAKSKSDFDKLADLEIEILNLELGVDLSNNAPESTGNIEIDDYELALSPEMILIHMGIIAFAIVPIYIGKGIEIYVCCAVAFMLIVNYFNDSKSE